VAIVTATALKEVGVMPVEFFVVQCHLLFNAMAPFLHQAYISKASGKHGRDGKSVT